MILFEAFKLVMNQLDGGRLMAEGTKEAENCGRREVPLQMLQFCYNRQNPFSHLECYITETGFDLY